MTVCNFGAPAACSVRQLGFGFFFGVGFLGISERASQRYADGQRKVPTAIVLLLGIMIKRNLHPTTVRKAAGLLPDNYSDARRS